MLTLTSLAVSASAALSDQGTGGSFDSASYGSYAYGWKSGKDLIWLMDVYVAKTEDGLIDTSKYSVTSAIDTSNIEYMGTMLYTNGFSGNCIMPTKSYISERISAISTTPVSVAIDPYHTVMQYKLPQTTASDNFSAPFFNSKSESFTYVTKFGERQIYVFNSEPHGLPTTISSSYNYSMTKDVIESDQFTADIVKDLKHCVGDTILTTLKSCLSQTVYDKAVESKDVSRLFPDSSKPLVQWAVVATPLALNTANAGTDIGFWITKDNTTDANSPSLEVATVQQHGSITYAMDAYTQSWYNSLTHEMLSNAKYREAISDKYGIPLTYLEKGSGTLAVNSSYPAQDKTYADWGLLRKEYGGDNYNKLADTAYIDSAKWPDHCLGIYSPKNYNNVDWHSGRDTYAKFGGITIAFSKMDEPQDIPVYCYITPTPNDPILPPSTATPPTFTPNPPAGTKVKKVVYPTDNSLVVPNNPPQDFPDPLPGNPPYTEITPTDGTYPIDPDNPPSHILVECVQTDIPIYYHVFTFTNTTGNDYKDVFEYLNDNPSVRESAAVENITAVGTTPILADGTKSTYTPQSSSSGTIVAALSTSGTNLGNSWSWLTQQGSTQLYKRMCSYKAFQACIILL